jgi:hypothetical protein
MSFSASEASAAATVRGDSCLLCVLEPPDDEAQPVNITAKTAAANKIFFIIKTFSYS